MKDRLSAVFTVAKMREMQVWIPYIIGMFGRSISLLDIFYYFCLKY